MNLFITLALTLAFLGTAPALRHAKLDLNQTGYDAINGIPALHEGGHDPKEVKRLHRYVSEASDANEKAERTKEALSILQHSFVQSFWKRFPTRGHFVRFVHSLVADDDSGVTWGCRLSILRTIESLVFGQTWVVELLDSWGKPGPGILNLNAVFRGDYRQCKNIKPLNPPFGNEANTKETETHRRAYDNLFSSFLSNRNENKKDIIGNKINSADQSQNLVPADGNGNTIPVRPITDEENIDHVITSSQSQALKWTSDMKHETRKENKAVVDLVDDDDAQSLLEDIAKTLEMMKSKTRGDHYGDDKNGKEKMFKTKYCRLGASSSMFKMDYIEVPILKVYLGPSLDVCIPDQCSAGDLNAMVNITIQAALFGSNPGLFIPEESDCHEPVPFESKTIGVLVFIAIGLGWLAFATLFDLWKIQRPRWKLQRLKENFMKKRAALLKSTENGHSNGQTHHHHHDNGNHDNGHGVAINNDDEEPLLVNGNSLRGNTWSSGRTVEDGRPSEKDGEQLEDILFKPPPISTGQRIIQFFSVYTNGAKILNTDIPPDTLSALHGIRFLSMCWIIIGHTLLISSVSVANIVEFLDEMKHYTLFLIISNGFLCVDVFFVISGMLVGYFFKDISEHESRYKWLVYVLHRFIRMTPAVMVTMAVYIGLWPYLSDGPGYPNKAPDEDMCKQTWWYTLLYVNNFLPFENMCMMWTWYLSCDYQFYLVCTLFMIPLHKGYRKFGITLGVTFALASMVAGGVVSYSNHIAEMLPQIITRHGLSHPRVYYDLFYQKPYCRMGPYVVGLLLGYTLQRTKRNIKMPMWVVIGGWILSTVVALSTLLGIHESYAGQHLMSDVQIALYNATKHTAFGLSIAWVLLACLTGHGGYINTILTWKPFIPLSRLTFCTYLVHPVVIYLYSYSQTGAVWLNIYNLLFTSLAIALTSIVAGAGLSVFVESPTIQLEREVLIRIGFMEPRHT